MFNLRNVFKFVICMEYYENCYHFGIRETTWLVSMFFTVIVIFF